MLKFVQVLKVLNFIILVLKIYKINVMKSVYAI